MCLSFVICLVSKRQQPPSAPAAPFSPLKFYCCSRVLILGAGLCSSRTVRQQAWELTTWQGPPCCRHHGAHASSSPQPGQQRPGTAPEAGTGVVIDSQRRACVRALHCPPQGGRQASLQTKPIRFLGLAGTTLGLSTVPGNVFGLERPGCLLQSVANV